MRNSTFGCAICSAMMCEPQRVQKRRNLPGEDSNAASSSPRTHRNAARGTGITLENAEPCVLRQVWQWQCTKGAGSASTSYATAPHRQLPVSMLFP
ncbi:hypothetical protein ACVME8_007785 [Bradyrhizobium diazoefficiens]